MKIEEQVLSIEQMKHLQELGVDTSDASLAWFMSPKTNQWKIKAKNNFAHELLLRLSYERYIPTYTTGDLIEKLPKSIGDYRLLIDWDSEIVYYQDWSGGEVLDHIGEYSFTDRPIMDALYDCLCWVAKTHKELLEVKK